MEVQFLMIKTQIAAKYFEKFINRFNYNLK